MRVKIIKAQPAYKIGDEYEVTNHDKDYYEYGHQLILKSDCTIITDETENRVPFDFLTWKEKGGRVWDFDNDEVTQIVEFDLGVRRQYAGVVNGQLLTFASDELTMSAPDEVWYLNTYKNGGKINGHSNLEMCKSWKQGNALHILEINITKGTNKIVHTYNEKV